MITVGTNDDTGKLYKLKWLFMPRSWTFAPSTCFYSLAHFCMKICNALKCYFFPRCKCIKALVSCYWRTFKSRSLRVINAKMKVRIIKYVFNVNQQERYLWAVWRQTLGVWDTGRLGDWESWVMINRKKWSVLDFTFDCHKFTIDMRTSKSALGNCDSNTTQLMVIIIIN